MIIEATYLGPFFRVKVPGYEHRLVKRDETTKLRIPEGRPIGGCWKIVKGKKAYEDGLKKAAADRAAKSEKRAKLRQKRKDQEEKRMDALVEGKTTKPDKKG